MNENLGYQNSDMQNPKKGKKGITVLIIVLILVILALGGYIVYDKVFSKDVVKKDTNTEVKKKESKKQEEKVQPEELDIASTTVQSLYTTITTGLGQYGGIWVYFTNNKVVTNDIPKNIVTSIVLNQFYKNNIININTANHFTTDQFDSFVDKIFGKNYSYTHATIPGCPVFTYDEVTRSYSSEVPQCGGTTGPGNEAKIEKAKKIGDKMEIYTRVVFMTPSPYGNSYDYFKDYRHTQPIEVDRDPNMNTMLQTDSNYAKGTLYKMIFTLEDGNYVFTSSEPVSE